MRCLTGFKQLTLSALLIGALGGCTQGPDMSGIAAEGKRPVQRYDVSQAIASNGKVVVVGTQSGAVLVSSDKGTTWQRQLLGQASLVDITVCDGQRFVAIDHYHKVWSADAEGKNWQSVPVEKPRIPLAVTCDANGGWWIVGTRAVIAGSADQGKTWAVTDLGEDTQITTIQFVDPQHGIALGEFGLMAETRDGGKTWTKGAKIPGDFYPYAALFKDAQQGWVSGIAGQIMQTRDGGKTWSKQLNTTGASLNRLFMHDGVPFGVGNAGVVARLEGDTWRNVPYPDPLPMFLGGGASLAGQSAVVIGGPGGLLRAVGTGSNNK